MIYIEKAPSNRSTCADCKRPIEAGQKRVVVSWADGGWSKKAFRCVGCAFEWLHPIHTEIEHAIVENIPF